MRSDLEQKTATIYRIGHRQGVTVRSRKDTNVSANFEKSEYISLVCRTNTDVSVNVHE